MSETIFMSTAGRGQIRVTRHHAEGDPTVEIIDSATGNVTVYLDDDVIKVELDRAEAED